MDVNTETVLSNKDPQPVIVVGQMPPPIHGQSVAIERIAGIRDDGFTIIPLPMNCSSEIESVGHFRLEKIRIAVRTACSLRRLTRQNSNAVVYYPPASPAFIPVLRDILFFLIAGRASRRWVYHFHAGGLPEYLSEKPWGRLAKCFYPKPMVCISMSQDSEPSPGAYFGGEDVIIPYGLDVPIPFEARGRGSPRRMLFVGNLFLSKGVGMALRALKRLRDEGADVVLDLVGGHVDRDREQVLALVRELGVGEFVNFHGVLSGEAKWERFREADCFVFPSHYPAEKFPNVLIEALGAGLPVVTTRWRGIPELMGEEVEGSRLVDPHDQGGLESALKAVLQSSDEQYATFCLASRKRYERCFTLDKFNRSILDAFHKASLNSPDAKTVTVARS